MKVIHTTGPNEGRVIDHPLHIARRMLAAGVAKRVPDDKRVTDVEVEYATSRAPETPEAPAESLESMTRKQLEDMAAEQGVEVERADGEDGLPLKSDYIRALGG